MRRGHVGRSSGYTATNDQISALDDALRREGVDADNQVISESALTDMATTVLRAFGIDGTAQANGPGKIVVAGYAENGARLNDVMRRLKTDVAGLRDVTDHIVTMDRARASPQQGRHRTADLTDVVKLTTTQRAIKVVGFLDRPRLARWSDDRE